MLCDIEGLSYEEIAVTLGIKLGTVRSRIHRARSQLRAALPHRDPAERPASDDAPTAVGARGGVTHLGSRLSALVDGQLSPAEAERALEHVACCPRCAAELAAARAARRALSAAGPVEPAPDLAARLLALSAEIPPTDGDPLRAAPAPSDPGPPPRRSRAAPGAATCAGARSGGASSVSSSAASGSPRSASSRWGELS